MENNIDRLTQPESEFEVFTPENAWEEDVERIYLSVGRGPGFVYQIGWDPSVQGVFYIRFKHGENEWLPWGPFDTGMAPPEAPVIDTIAPESAEIGSADVTLKVTGQNFTPDSVIVFNGGDEVTTFVNDTRLTTGVKPSLASAAITVPVLVRGPGGESNSVDFEFTEVAPVTKRR